MFEGRACVGGRPRGVARVGVYSRPWTVSEYMYPVQVHGGVSPVLATRGVLASINCQTVQWRCEPWDGAIERIGRIRIHIGRIKNLEARP